MGKFPAKQALAILIISVLLAPALVLILTTQVEVVSASPGWWNDNWPYRVSITLAIGENVPPENYQYNFTLDNADNLGGHVAFENFQDLRFWEDEVSGELDFWIENYVSGDNAIFWVKREDNSLDDNTIYCYYGNASAGSAENITDTFILGDDFAGTTIDSSKWTEVDANNYITQNENLIISGGPSNYTHAIYSADNIARPFIFEFKWYATDQKYSGQGVKDTTTGVNYDDFVYLLQSYSTNPQYYYWYDGNAGGTVGSYSSGTQYWMRFVVMSTGSVMYQSENNIDWVLVEDDSGYSNESPLKVGWHLYQQQFEVDDVKIRAYVSPEPTVSAGAEETFVMPTKPVLYSPENNESTSDITPTFEWTNGENADNHRIEVDNDSNFGSVTDNVIVTENTWTKTAPGYLNDNYYWRVVAFNESGENESATWKFEINLAAPALIWEYYDAGGYAVDIAMSADGKFLAGGTELSDTLYFWGEEDNSPDWTYNLIEELKEVEMSDDGKYIVSGDVSNYIILFENTDNTPIWMDDIQYNRPTVGISASGLRIVGSNSFGTCHLFDNADNIPIWTYIQGNYSTASVSSDGNYVIAVFEDYICKFTDNDNTPVWQFAISSLWENADTITGETAISSDGTYSVVMVGGEKEGPPSGFSTSSLLLFSNDNNPVWKYDLGVYPTTPYGLDISSSGHRISASIGDDIKIFDNQDNNSIWSWSLGSHNWSNDLNPTGKYLVAGSGTFGPPEEGYFWFFSIDDNELKTRYDLGSLGWDVAITDDATKAFASSDHTRKFFYFETGLVSIWREVETWSGTVEAPVAWSIVETWTGTLGAPAAWQLIETWTGTVEAFAEWDLVETWTGAVEAPAAWQEIENWAGSVEAPAGWQLIETWSGSLEAPVAWQLIETWTGTVEAFSEWQLIETWSGTIEAFSDWQLLETWTGTIEAPAQWQIIETWSGTVEASAAWQLVETWTGAINASVGWYLIESWSGTIQAPSAWDLMETWSGTVEAPSAWNLTESWTGTVQAPTAWVQIESWTGTVLAYAEWQSVESWAGTIQAPAEWSEVENWSGGIIAVGWQLIESWAGTVETHRWVLIETWTGLLETPAVYAVSVSITPAENSGTLGGTLTFTVIVVNIGGTIDNYDLASSDALGWTTYLDNDNFLDVPSGENRETTLNVGLSTTGTHEVIVTATGTGVSDSDNCTAISATAPDVIQIGDGNLALALGLMAIGLAICALLVAMILIRKRREEEGVT